jgi:O-antigen ligase
MSGLAVRTDQRPARARGGGFTMPHRRTVIAVGAGLLLAAASGPLVARSAAAAVALAVALIGAAILAFIRGRPMGEVVIILMVLISGLVDIPQRISVGPTTGQGAETIGMLAIMLLVILSGYLATGVPQISRVWPIGLFVLWTYLSFTWGGDPKQGLQNVFVYSGFFGAIVIAATVGRWSPDGGYKAIDWAFRIAAVIGLGLYAIGLAHGGGAVGHPGVIVSPRPFGLFGVLIIAWFASGDRIGIWWAKYVIAATVLLTVLSLSRSALAAQLAIIVLARWEPRSVRSWIRTGAVVVGALAVALVAIFEYAPLHHRFFHGATANVGGFSLNVTGRSALWSANWGWFTEKPWIGWGAGASDTMTNALPGHNAGHPHNDYLRLLVDFGVVGLALWLIGFFIVLRLTWKAWQSVRNTHTPAERVHSAAFLALVGIALCMIVDNPLIEVVKMGPLGLLVGLSLGIAAATAASQPAYPATAPAAPVPEAAASS